jgi:hypothetical protein
MDWWGSLTLPSDAYLFGTFEDYFLVAVKVQIPDMTKERAKGRPAAACVIRASILRKPWG